MDGDDEWYPGKLYGDHGSLGILEESGAGQSNSEKFRWGIRGEFGSHSEEFGGIRSQKKEFSLRSIAQT